MTNHAPLAGDLSPGPVGERWRKKKKIYSLCVYMCEYARVCAYVLLPMDTLDYCGVLPLYCYHNTLHYFVYFARTELN